MWQNWCQGCFLRFPVGHAYLCADPGGLTLFDTSVPGSAPQLGAAIRQIGCQPVADDPAIAPT
jgi:hypothetical protein